MTLDAPPAHARYRAGVRDRVGGGDVVGGAVLVENTHPSYVMTGTRTIAGGGGSAIQPLTHAL